MLQVVFCFSDFSEASFTIPLEGSSTEGMCFSSSTLSHVLAATLWVMGFFHSLFGNGTYNILPEQNSMGKGSSPEHGSMGEELLPEQSSMEEGSSLCLGAELNKGQELAVSWSKAQ